jgi:hypothetical protein
MTVVNAVDVLPQIASQDSRTSGTFKLKFQGKDVDTCDSCIFDANQQSHARPRVNIDIDDVVEIYGEYIFDQDRFTA